MIRYNVRAQLKCACAQPLGMQGDDTIVIEEQMGQFRDEKDDGMCRLVLCKDATIQLPGYGPGSINYICQTPYSEQLVRRLITNYFTALRMEPQKSCPVIHDFRMLVTIEKRIDQFPVCFSRQHKGFDNE